MRARTGLLLDPVFLRHQARLDPRCTIPEARGRAARGELAFGTIDSFLLWRLTDGRVHATDAANACRTLLFDIHRQCWDDELLRLFRIPANILPEVRDNSSMFGDTTLLFGSAHPVAGMAGDQQAALIGQACFAPGMTKVHLRHRLLRAAPHRHDGRSPRSTGCSPPSPTASAANRSYAVEGAIFVAGAAVKWLRDGHRPDHPRLADRRHGDPRRRQPRRLHVPGFVGLGAPHWNPDARGLICGLTLDATAAHIARAALESVAYQTVDLTDAMTADAGEPGGALRIDGGMSANDWLCQFLADMLQAPVERPAVLETTALGAAFLAGLATGIFPTLDAIAATWSLAHRFVPQRTPAERDRLLGGWRGAVRRALA